MQDWKCDFVCFLQTKLEDVSLTDSHGLSCWHVADQAILPFLKQGDQRWHTHSKNVGQGGVLLRRVVAACFFHLVSSGLY